MRILIILFLLLILNAAKAEVVLRCILDPEFNNQRITVEIDLKKTNGRKLKNVQI